jgi:hypothetical protein
MNKNFLLALLICTNAHSVGFMLNLSSSLTPPISLISGNVDIKETTNQHIKFISSNGQPNISATFDNGSLANLQFNSGSEIDFALNGSQGMFYNNNGLITAKMVFNTGLYTSGSKLLCDTGTPAISGFGTGATIVGNSMCSFSINVGTGGTATSGSITSNLSAPNSWSCSGNNITSNTSLVIGQSFTSSSSVTLNSYSRTTGLSSAFSASDILGVICFAN